VLVNVQVVRSAVHTLKYYGPHNGILEVQVIIGKYALAVPSDSTTSLFEDTYRSYDESIVYDNVSVPHLLKVKVNTLVPATDPYKLVKVAL